MSRLRVMTMLLNFETPAPNKNKFFVFCQTRSFKNRDFGGFRPSNHGESIGLAESYSKMGINFSGDE